MISIEPMYQAFLDGLAPLFEGAITRTTEKIYRRVSAA